MICDGEGGLDDDDTGDEVIKEAGTICGLKDGKRMGREREVLPGSEREERLVEATADV